MDPISKAFIGKLEAFARERGLDVVPFEKGRLKDDVAAEYRKRFRGNRRPTSGVRQEAWGTALRRAGIDDFTFHDLRHTFASYLVMAGVDIRTVQTLLGHKSIVMTMRYAHLSPAHLKEAIAVLGSAGPRTKQDQGAFREVAASPNSLK